MHEDAAEADRRSFEGSRFDPRALQEEPLITSILADTHDVDGFICSKSPRVAGFFAREAKKLVVAGFCKVFVAPNPDLSSMIWGYYTLSAAQVQKFNLSGSDEKRVVREALGYAPPMARIGFMGKHDGAPPEFGKLLLVDAARRIARQDNAAIGIVLEPEGGKDNAKLWRWYTELDFPHFTPLGIESLPVVEAGAREFRRFRLGAGRSKNPPASKERGERRQSRR